MRLPGGLCSRFPKKNFQNLPHSLNFFDCSLKRNVELLPRIYFDPSSLEKFANAPINKNGKFPFALLSSYSPCLVWLLRPFCFVIEVQPALNHMQLSQTRDYHLSVDWLISCKLPQTSLSIMCMTKLTQTSLAKFFIRFTHANCTTTFACKLEVCQSLQTKVCQCRLGLRSCLYCTSVTSILQQVLQISPPFTLLRETLFLLSEHFLHLLKKCNISCTKTVHFLYGYSVNSKAI